MHGHFARKRSFLILTEMLTMPQRQTEAALHEEKTCEPNPA
jgi:hypothetical protein